VSRNQLQSATSTSRSSFINGEDDTTTESRSSFIQGKDDTTIEPLSAAEHDYGNDDDSYEPYSHNRSDDDTNLDEDDEEECSLSTICLHLQAAMTMKMVSLLPQILMQQLPTILMSTQDAEMSFTWTPPRRRC
jgi:hypothetical protein